MTDTDYLNPANYATGKTGPQFQWLDERLTVHGYPPISYADTFMRRVKQFQEAQGWRGTGADGYVGPKTLKLLSFDPEPPSPPNVLELSKFKRTLPTGEDGDPDELYPLSDTAEPVTFRARVDGVRTENTKYARDELREMHPKEWTARDGYHHKMTAVCRVTEIPGRKGDYTPGVVIGQIHDATDDIVILLVDINGRVIVEEGLGPGNGSNKYELFTGYRLGEKLSYVIDAHPAGIDVTVNGHHIRIRKLAEDAYFKAGEYNRGNQTNATGAGSATFDLLKVSHQ